jgi:hypothetical protein
MKFSWLMIVPAPIFCNQALAETVKSAIASLAEIEAIADKLPDGRSAP